MKITTLEFKPKHAIGVTLSTGEQFTIHEDVLVNLGLYKGMDISSDLMTTALAQDAFHRAKNRALYYLDFGPRSKRQMYDYLVKHEYDPNTALEVVNWLEANCLLNDLELAQRYVENWTATKAYGPMMIKQKLREKGFTSDTMDAIIWPDDNEMYDKVLLMAQKKWSSIKGPTDYERKSKLYRFLYQRGYESELIRSVIEEVTRHA